MHCYSIHYTIAPDTDRLGVFALASSPKEALKELATFLPHHGTPISEFAKVQVSVFEVVGPTVFTNPHIGLTLTGTGIAGPLEQLLAGAEAVRQS